MIHDVPHLLLVDLDAALVDAWREAFADQIDDDHHGYLPVGSATVVPTVG